MDVVISVDCCYTIHVDAVEGYTTLVYGYFIYHAVTVLNAGGLM